MALAPSRGLHPSSLEVDDLLEPSREVEDLEPICPVTLESLSHHPADQVVDVAGIWYDREACRKFLQNRLQCPATRRELRLEDVKPLGPSACKALLAIQELQRANCALNDALRRVTVESVQEK